MPHRAAIRRRTRAKGTLGGSVDSWTNEQTAVKCWEQAATHSEVVEYQKAGMDITHKVYFTSDPGVRRRHQILITERNGVTVTSPIPLDVVSESFPDASAGKQIVFKVMCYQNPAESD